MEYGRSIPLSTYGAVNCPGLKSKDCAGFSQIFHKSSVRSMRRVISHVVNRPAYGWSLPLLLLCHVGARIQCAA